MNWNDSKEFLKRSLEPLTQILKVSGAESTQSLRQKQYFRLGVGASVAVMGFLLVLGLFEDDQAPPPSSKRLEEKPTEHSVKNMATPLSSVNESEGWIARIEKLIKEQNQELNKVRSENVFLEKQINTLVTNLHKASPNLVEGVNVGNTNSHKTDSGTHNNKDKTSISTQSFSPQELSNQPQRFPKVGDEGGSLKSESISSKLNPYAPRKRRQLLHLSSTNPADHSMKSPEVYLPAGTYFKVVTAMGVVVSTGTNSASDPQPILLRIVDNGNLPGGLKGIVKDAVLIGSCYGSASAERAICRLKTLSWRDKSNRNIEKSVEGWIASEDGVQGIRAKIIDRSSEIAREAFGAGLLSAASNFFKYESTSGVYPMTPFGQTNALGKGAALQGAAASGVGSALDKLAEFSIKRAESMSPVAYVASGRVLDAVLMRGVDLSPLSQDSLNLVSSSDSSSSSNSHAQMGEQSQ